MRLNERQAEALDDWLIRAKVSHFFELTSFASISLVIAIMSLAFFAQGMSAISWTLVSDLALKELLGLAGGVFNFAGNMGSIVTPLVIGFILASTNSFSGGLAFMSAVALVGALLYIFIVGKVYRIELPGDRARLEQSA